MTRWLLVGVLLSGSGCSESTTLETDAGSDITFDATLPSEMDAGAPAPDAGPPESAVGAGCASDADCDTGFCVTEAEGFAGGYCTAACGTDEDCPGPDICLGVGGGMSLCFDTCDPAGERDCRSGYGCGDSFMLPAPICLPGCYDDTDCDDRTCNPDGGFSGEGSCFNPDADLGDACERSEDCADDAFCLAERFAGYPGGSCISGGCDVDANTGCPAGAHCLRGRRSGRCWPGCTDDAECRDGYACLPDDELTDRSVCRPACADDTNCTGGRSCDPMEGRCR